MENNLQLDGILKAGQFVEPLKVGKGSGGFKPNQPRRLPLGEAEFPAIKPKAIKLWRSFTHTP